MTTTDPGLVFRISLSSAAAALDEGLTEMEITRSLRRFDPGQDRFVSSASFTILSFDEFQRLHPTEAVDYATCRQKAHAEDQLPIAPPSYVLTNTPLRCDQLGDLTTSDMAYLAESIRILSQLDIAHADIHTNNIMMRNGRPVLIDWGKSQIHARSKGLALLDERMLADARTQNMALKRDRERQEAVAAARAAAERDARLEEPKSPVANLFQVGRALSWD